MLKTGLFDRHGSRVSVTRGFLTSDIQLAGAVKIKTFYLALSGGIHPLNSSKLFRRWMESHYGKDVLEVGVTLFCIHGNTRDLIQVEVKANRTAVVSYKSKTGEPAPMTIPYLFSGETVTLYQAFLIWLPFSLPLTEVCVCVGSCHMLIM